MRADGSVKRELPRLIADGQNATHLAGTIEFDDEFDDELGQRVGTDGNAYAVELCSSPSASASTA